MIVLSLPSPPGANNLFINLGKGKGRARSPEYNAWINEAGWLVQSQRQKPVTEPVTVTIVAQENQRRDIDGFAKPLLDLLVTHRLIPDDRCKYVRAVNSSWSSEIQGCRVTVEPWGGA